MKVYRINDYVRLESVYKGEEELLLKLENVLQSLNVNCSAEYIVPSNKLIKVILRVAGFSTFTNFIKQLVKKEILQKTDIKEG